MLRCDITIEKHRFLDRNEFTMFFEIIKKISFDSPKTGIHINDGVSSQLSTRKRRL